MDPLTALATFEIRSFIRSLDNGGRVTRFSCYYYYFFNIIIIIVFIRKSFKNIDKSK